jgi:tetratricopeptide (TPR) repeat protein
MKLKVIFCVFILQAAFVASQQRKPAIIPVVQPYWYTLEEGKKAFREGDYGTALAKFESARNERKNVWDRHESNFISLLSLYEVRRLSDSLEDVEKYIKEGYQSGAEKALSELTYHIDKLKFNNSAKSALEYLGLMKEYPEAEFWIGEVYRLEGEKNIAISQYRKALDSNVETASTQWTNDVLYKIAEVCADVQNYTEMENALNTIIKNETLWTDSGSFARNAMRNTLRSGGIDKFLIMFRHGDTGTEKAHRLLGYYHYVSGRYDLAEPHFMFAALIQSSTLVSEAIRKRYNFEFTTLDNLMVEISRRKDLHKFIEDVAYYETLYYLGASLYATGYEGSARGIWSFVSKQKDGGRWASRSANQLKSPFIESAIIMP